MRAHVHIFYKNGVLDPQGRAIAGALGNLGFEGVKDVTQGKLIVIDLDHDDADQARSQVIEMCEKLLANTVIENYAIEMEPDT
jgi:phosphoribosylformylglycinamidine synthase